MPVTPSSVSLTNVGQVGIEPTLSKTPRLQRGAVPLLRLTHEPGPEGPGDFFLRAVCPTLTNHWFGLLVAPIAHGKPGVNRSKANHSELLCCAWAEGLEPSFTVLETGVLAAGRRPFEYLFGRGKACRLPSGKPLPFF